MEPTKTKKSSPPKTSRPFDGMKFPQLRQTPGDPAERLAGNRGPAPRRDEASELPPPLPMTRSEMEARGWAEVDVVFVTGDAYVDHPSFAMALLGRLLEAAGFRVAMLSQPDWRSADPWRTFGRPRLFYAISAGNMDSMVNHYTANKKVRNDDAYSPGGVIGKRPDRATLAYCQRAREAYKGVPVIAGGVEASLRRVAHYDYWSDKVRRSILMDCKADLLCFGMGERTILTIAKELDRGTPLEELRSLRGVAYRLGAKESIPEDAPWSVESFRRKHGLSPKRPSGSGDRGAEAGESSNAYWNERSEKSEQEFGDAATDYPDDVIVLPSYEETASDTVQFAHMTRMAHHETNPLNARRLVQKHAAETIVVNPPNLPLSQPEMDLVYGLPFTRRPHPSYGDQKIPAFQVVKTSVQIMRGCFGGCTFCSITAHEGRIIQSRSKESVLAEVKAMTRDEDFKGTVSDIGGPTANMYEMRCTKPEVEAICRRQSCVHPKICKLLGTDHGPLLDLMKDAREIPGVKKVFVASGIRMDLARRDPKYMKELAQHHVGGYLKVAPEHTHPRVLDLMKKPDGDDFVEFGREFKKASKSVGKDQYLIPYYISSHPGSDLEAMIHLALFLKRNGYKPDQVQDFIPSPFDIAACMYHTGLDPMTMKPVYIAKKMRDRKFQRALLQFFKPENYFEVREALKKAGRSDLIGEGCDCLIPSRPPRAALDQRRKRANDALTEHREGDHIRGNPRRAGSGSSSSKNGPGKGGYRPHRQSSVRRSRKG